MDSPIIPCDLCGSQDGLQRQQVKSIIDGWEKNSPGRRQVMFRSLMNTRPSHLLDTSLFDFLNLHRKKIGQNEAISELKMQDFNK
jgi:tRNA 2-thiocytidine biosynthesis protein TtcA